MSLRWGSAAWITVGSVVSTATTPLLPNSVFQILSEAHHLTLNPNPNYPNPNKPNPNLNPNPYPNPKESSPFNMASIEAETDGMIRS